MPHVTLLYPFRPQDEFELLLPGFNAAAVDIDPFEVELGGFRSFGSGGRRHTLWLAPEPVDGLQVLQARLQEVTPDCDDVRRHPNGFTPHLSVSQAEGAQEAHVRLQELSGDWEPIRFEAARVQLICREDPPGDVFRLTHTIPLGRG